MDLTAIYAPIQDDLDRLQEVLRHELASDDPFIGELVQYVLSTRGKMIRPALVCLSAQASGGAGDARLWIAAAVELIHIASLIHDDIIDASDVRRGAATVNAQWGNQLAVLLGDFLFAKAFELLSRVRHPEMAPTMAVATVKMSQAEIIQIKYGQEPHDNEGVYLQIIAGKTAHLFSAACRAGAMIARNPLAADVLGAYGLQWGMAFQITDDALDLTSREEALGKPIHSDIPTGKVTLPIIRALRDASAADRVRLISLLTGSARDGQVAEVDRLLRRYRGIEYALEVARKFSDQAAATLTPLEASPAKESLLRLTEFVVVRAK